MAPRRGHSGGECSFNCSDTTVIHVGENDLSAAFYVYSTIAKRVTLYS